MYTLFLSSICMTLGHVSFIVISHRESFIKWVYLTGCATSLMNHFCKSKNRHLQTLDRVVMAFGAANDLFYIHDSYTFSLWFASVYFYVYSKIFKSVGVHENVVPFHVMAHVCVTMCHANILTITF
jgi:hypothetical protein